MPIESREPSFPLPDNVRWSDTQPVGPVPEMAEEPLSVRCKWCDGVIVELAQTLGWWHYADGCLWAICAEPEAFGHEAEPEKQEPSS